MSDRVPDPAGWNRIHELETRLASMQTELREAKSALRDRPATRAIRGFLNAFAAAMEKQSVQLHEYNKHYADREYFRGYAEGVKHGREWAEAERKGKP
jgi:hypothetical protein